MCLHWKRDKINNTQKVKIWEILDFWVYCCWTLLSRHLKYSGWRTGFYNVFIKATSTIQQQALLSGRHFKVPVMRTKRCKVPLVPAAIHMLSGRYSIKQLSVDCSLAQIASIVYLHLDAEMTSNWTTSSIMSCCLLVVHQNFELGLVIMKSDCIVYHVLQVRIQLTCTLWVLCANLVWPAETKIRNFNFWICTFVLVLDASFQGESVFSFVPKSWEHQMGAVIQIVSSDFVKLRRIQ